MPKKHVTKIDPKEALERYLNHQSDQSKNKNHAKVSASLSKLQSERRKALITRLGSILLISFIALGGLGYYISPLANVNSVQIEGDTDLPTKKVVQVANIKPSDKIFDYLINQGDVNANLTRHYPEIKRVDLHVKHYNQLVLQVHEYKTIGYIRKENGYRKILADNKLGSQLLSWEQVNHDKPVFIGYNHEVSLKKNLQLFYSLPSDFQARIKLLSGNTRRKSQVIFLMKDGNVIIGDVSTLKHKLKYYNDIKNKVGKNNLIDLEVGAFSRPLTENEERIYGLK